MYSTGILLIVCAVPATVILSFVFMRDQSVRFSRSQALAFGASMIAIEVFIAVILLVVAERITKRRHRISQSRENDA
jgi:hypothetical protein